MKYEEIQKLFDKYYEMCLLPSSSDNKKIVIDELWEMIDSYLINMLSQDELDLYYTCNDDEKEFAIHTMFKGIHSREINNSENYMHDTHKMNKEHANEFLLQHLWSRRN